MHQKYMNFETSYKRLEEAAAALRNDSVSLEDSLKNFETASKHYNECKKIIEEARQRLIVLEKETGTETVKEI